MVLLISRTSASSDNRVPAITSRYLVDDAELFQSGSWRGWRPLLYLIHTHLLIQSQRLKLIKIMISSISIRKIKALQINQLTLHVYLKKVMLLVILLNLPFSIR